MAHRLAPEVESELDDIWYYIARESGSIEIADRLIDSITARFFSSRQLPLSGTQPRRGSPSRFAELSQR